MRRTLAALLAVAFTAHAAQAQSHPMPYEAVILSDGVKIYSGPGLDADGRPNFYATDRLNRGTPVTVHRHDPGGWYVISPPEGSFSWIRADYVRSQDGRTGTVTAGNVIVQVGSALGEDRDVYQRTLSRGDRVEILGEQTFRTADGPARMYKIVSPRGEFRFVQGKYVGVAGAAQTPGLDAASEQSHGPSAEKTQTPARSKPSGTARRVVRSSRNHAADKPAAAGSQPHPLAEKHDELEELDHMFRAIIQRETAEWDFTQLENDYNSLKENVQDEVFQALLRQRLAAVKRYQAIKHEYDEFVRLTSETTRKDKQLLAIQQKQAAGVDATTASSEPAPELAAPQTRRAEKAGNQPPAPIPAAPQTTPRRTGPPQRPGAPSHGIQPQRDPTSRVVFDGAGILRLLPQAPPGAPRHVLTDREGRVLAYVIGGWAVPLDRYVGQAVGVNGRNQYRPELRSHLIRVRRLVPVQLAGERR